MKKICLFFIATFIVLNLAAQRPQASAAIDSLLNYLKTNNRFSGSVAIQQGNKIMYAGDFNRFPKGTSTYRIGSVSKIYTALIVYRLIEENKLSLNTSIEKYFPNIKYAGQITIANLLSHTSGIFNITDMKNYSPPGRNSSRELKCYLSSVRTNLLLNPIRIATTVIQTTFYWVISLRMLPVKAMYKTCRKWLPRH